MDVKKLIKNVNFWMKEILKENYVGCYFHGSLRLGSFNPNKSDLDFIVVVNNKLDYITKEKICEIMLQNESLFPKKGFEFSVVLKEHCKNIIYPTPYELHMSKDWIQRYYENKSNVINDKFKVDPDLISHFNVINVKNDEFDFGCPSNEIFCKVPKKYVIASNYLDIKDCVENIIDNPIYSILNLCRFYAYIKEDLTLSKYDGGKWAINNFFGYEALILKAMEDYLDDTNKNYNINELKDFAQYSITKIENFLNN